MKAECVKPAVETTPVTTTAADAASPGTGSRQQILLVAAEIALHTAAAVPVQVEKTVAAGHAPVAADIALHVQDVASVAPQQQQREQAALQQLLKQQQAWQARKLKEVEIAIEEESKAVFCRC